MNYWIFQAIPKQFDIREKLDAGMPLTWYATRYHKKMEPNDIVFFWLGGVSVEKKGIYGWGRLTSTAYKKDDWDSNGVDLKVMEIFKNPITLPDITRNEVLSNMLILRMAIGTNFLLSDNEAMGIQALCKNLNPNTDFTKSIKGGVL